MNEHGIFLIQDYGKIELRLREVMDARGINRNRLARLRQCPLTRSSTNGIRIRWRRSTPTSWPASVLSLVVRWGISWSTGKIEPFRPASTVSHGEDVV